MSYACFCILNIISDSEIGPFWPQFLPKNHTHFNFLWKSSKIASKVSFPWEICFFINIPQKRLLRPLEIAVFALKMTYFRCENGPLWTTPTSNFEIFFMILAENLISFLKVFNFLINHQIWLSYTCLCILRSILDSKIGLFWPQFWPENHTHFYFFYWNHQILPKKNISHQKFGFS